MAKKAIVAELRAWRAGQGLTLEEAGAKIVLEGKPASRSMFHAWETGAKLPSYDYMLELERVTGVSPNCFYTRPSIAPQIQAPRQGALAV